jgi:hypothetical protein
VSSGWVRRLSELSRPPTGVDRLLRVWLADDRTAADTWADFERDVDLDHLPDAEMCLVGLVSKRLPTIASTSRLRGRIGGIERAGWSCTQLTIGEAAKALELLATQDIPTLLVGSGARIATGDTLGRGLRIETIEMCVRPADFPRAHDLLVADGWQFAPPSPVNRNRIQSVSSSHFVRGRFAAIELRQSPFPDPVSADFDAITVWRRAVRGRLGEAAVLLPSPTDALTVAIADGLRRSCFNSLWLADVAMAASDGIDWQLFEDQCGRHGLEAAAFHSLLYAHDRLARAVPGGPLGNLEKRAAKRTLHTLALLLECRAGSRATFISRSMLRVARRVRGFVPAHSASTSLTADHRAS